MSAERLTLDANVLVYAVDTREPSKQAAAIEIIVAAARMRSKLGLQAIGEFYVASTRKVKVTPAVARRRVEYLLSTFEVFQHTRASIAEAAAQAAARRYFFWDAVLLASADEAGCTVMLSEDMHDGAKFGNIVVRNPFGPNGLSDAAKKALSI